MRTPPIFALLLATVLAPHISAQLSAEQKINDFLYLADSVALQYGPYEWKREAFGVDAFDLRPWLDRIRRSRTDLEYAELAIEYLRQLDDAHVSISFPFSFSGSLGFGVDIYDGKPLIESINRVRLPIGQFAFATGDELISIDGVPAMELIVQLRKYVSGANPRSRDRLAATLLTSRNQSVIPSLTTLPEFSAVQIRLANGNVESFNIPWLISGEASTSFGAVFLPRPRTAHSQRRAAGVVADDDLPPHMEPMREYLDLRVTQDPEGLLGYGAREPVFTMPANFVQRFGRVATDFYFSGVFEAEGLRIGFIRIPNFSPPSTAVARQQFEDEMRFFQANTQGLVIDVMRNTGGSIAFLESLAQLVHTANFRTLGYEIRASAGWVFSMQTSVNTAKASNAPSWIVDLLEFNLAQIKQANSELRGRTGPISLNSTGSLELLPSPFAYTRPIMVLVDEFSTSAGDAFPAILQDNRRAQLFGWRTRGAGGNVVRWLGSANTESSFGLTQSLMNRKDNVVTEDFPAAPYVENIGVRPEVQEDYMTRENLMTGGRPFVNAFTRAAVEHIRRNP